VIPREGVESLSGEFSIKSRILVIPREGVERVEKTLDAFGRPSDPERGS
jgi:hypothetical protein